MAAEGPDVATFLGLLVVATLVAATVRRLRLPYEVALVLAGLGLAVIPGVPQIIITHQVILTVFLPIVLFHGAYNLPLLELRSVFRLVSFLALPGVLATAGLVGLALHLVAGMSWTSALLFGTIVAATDPVSVLAIFGQLGAPRRLITIVSGESLFNDGTALVLFAIALQVAQGDGISLLGGIGRLIVVIGGSLVLGAAAGLLGALTLRQVEDALVETSITLIIAYGGYLLADHLALSGPLETVAAGILLSTRGERVMSPTTRMQAGATWEFLDFLANSLLFLLMGLAVRSVALTPGEHLGSGLIRPLLVALVAVVLARVLVVEGTSRMLRLFGRPLPEGWGTVLVWAGLRGAVSLAAVLSLPPGLADHDLLLTLTFGVVLFTLGAQGLTVAPLLRRLGLTSLNSTAPPAVAAIDIPLSVHGEVDDSSLARPLQAYQRRYALSDADLATYLELPEIRLKRLGQYVQPEAGNAHREHQVTQIADEIGCNAARLGAVLNAFNNSDPTVLTVEETDSQDTA